MEPTLQHLALNCRDLSAQEDFYSRHFGFERARVFNRGEPEEFVMLRLGGFRMELFQSSEATPEDRAGPRPVGFKHLCFEVEDVKRKRDELEEAGANPGPVIDCSEDVPGLKVCFLADPEGNVLELMEGWRDQENPPGP